MSIQSNVNQALAIGAGLFTQTDFYKTRSEARRIGKAENMVEGLQRDLAERQRQDLETHVQAGKEPPLETFLEQAEARTPLLEEREQLAVRKAMLTGKQEHFNEAGFRKEVAEEGRMIEAGTREQIRERNESIKERDIERAAAAQKRAQEQAQAAAAQQEVFNRMKDIAQAGRGYIPENYSRRGEE